MLKENIFNLVFVIVASVLLLVLPYITHIIPFLQNIVLLFEKNHYIKLGIKLLLFSYLVQLSAVVHELGHAFIGSKPEGLTNIPKSYYIPIYGFKSSMNIFTYTNTNNSALAGLAGFIPQIIYLLITSFIFFKGSAISIALTSIGFIIYMFIHYSILDGGDFLTVCNNLKS